MCREVDKTTVVEVVCKLVVGREAVLRLVVWVRRGLVVSDCLVTRRVALPQVGGGRGG